MKFGRLRITRPDTHWFELRIWIEGSKTSAQIPQKERERNFKLITPHVIHRFFFPIETKISKKNDNSSSINREFHEEERNQIPNYLYRKRRIKEKGKTKIAIAYLQIIQNHLEENDASSREIQRGIEEAGERSEWTDQSYGFSDRLEEGENMEDEEAAKKRWKKILGI